MVRNMLMHAVCGRKREMAAAVGGRRVQGPLYMLRIFVIDALPCVVMTITVAFALHNLFDMFYLWRSHLVLGSSSDAYVVIIP